MLKALSRLIDFITWIISFLLISRFVLKFFEAGASAPFTAWLYAITSDLLSPFMGIFPTIRLTTGNIVEFTTLLAAVIYGLVGYAISAFFDSVADNLSYRSRKKEESLIAPKMHDSMPQAYYQPPVNQPIDPKN